jgi:hypothetical protein
MMLMARRRRIAAASRPHRQVGGDVDGVSVYAVASLPEGR